MNAFRQGTRPGLRQRMRSLHWPPTRLSLGGMPCHLMPRHARSARSAYRDLIYQQIVDRPEPVTGWLPRCWSWRCRFIDALWESDIPTGDDRDSDRSATIDHHTALNHVRPDLIFTQRHMRWPSESEACWCAGCHAKLCLVRRYYSGCLYLEALLHLSGRYRAWL